MGFIMLVLEVIRLLGDLVGGSQWQFCLAPPHCEGAKHKDL